MDSCWRDWYGGTKQGGSARIGRHVSPIPAGSRNSTSGWPITTTMNKQKSLSRDWPWSRRTGAGTRWRIGDGGRRSSGALFDGRRWRGGAARRGAGGGAAGWWARARGAGRRAPPARRRKRRASRRRSVKATGAEWCGACDAAWEAKRALRLIWVTYI